MNKKIIIILLLLLLIIGSSLLTIWLLNNKEYDESISVDLYKNLIDKYVSDLNSLNTKYDYIYIDQNSLKDVFKNTNLSNDSINDILNYYEKYNKNNETKKDLLESAIIEMNINFNISKKDNNKITMNINYSIKNSNSIGGRNYVCEYTKNNWKITNGNSSWSS